MAGRRFERKGLKGLNVSLRRVLRKAIVRVDASPSGAWNRDVYGFKKASWRERTARLTFRRDLKRHMCTNQNAGLPKSRCNLTILVC
jgi:hypothetical protein